MSDSDDVRGGERHSAALRIRLKYSDEAHFIERYAANISRGGIFVGTRTPKPVGTWLRFEFQLEGGLTVIRGEGSVAWVSPFDPAQPERPYGMGVRFDKLDDASQRVIERALQYKEKRRRAAQAVAAKEEAAARAKAKASGQGKPRREVRPDEATRQLDAEQVLALSSAMRAAETAVGVPTGAEAASPVEARPAPPPSQEEVAQPPTVAVAAPLATPPPAPAGDDERADEAETQTPSPVIELVAEPGEADEDLPPPPTTPPPRRAPPPPPRPSRRTSPPPLPTTTAAGSSAASAPPPAAPEPGPSDEAQAMEPQPLPPPPLEEVQRPVAPAAAPTRVLGRLALVPGRRARRAETTLTPPAVDRVAPPSEPRAEPVPVPEPAIAASAPGAGEAPPVTALPELAPAIRAIGAIEVTAASPVEGEAERLLHGLLAESGLAPASVDEVAARARARTAALVEKLAGDEGELDWLLEPPRPEPLPTPAQARALLDRWLSTSGERRP